MSDDLGSLIPTRYIMKLWPVYYEQRVIINWLEVQVPRPIMSVAEEETLDELKGWRNREVFDYVKSYDWTARTYG